MKSILICIFLALSVTIFSQERRLALVIGNSNYENGNILKNPVSDVHLISFTLEDLGFDVISATDASLGEMKEAIADFLKQLAGKDVALFYYSGHGMQLEGINYLIPVDAKLNKPNDLKKEAIDAGKLVSQFGSLSTKINIAILDVCGDAPFRAWLKEGAEGLAPMTASARSIIVLTASPGTTVSKGTGSNGLYAENLTRQMMIPQPIKNVFTNTGLLVNHSSKGKQEPEIWSMYEGSFGLIRSGAQPIHTSGSIVLTSQIAGNLSIDGVEIASVEPNSTIPLDNIESGTYELKISGQDSWEEVVLVLGNQTTNVNAISVVESESQTENEDVEKGDVYIDTRDMNKYPWKEFGSQIWMTRNLSFNDPNGSYCYDNNSSDCDIYGRLYIWQAAQQVCPEGWHLPSDEEWMILEQSIGMNEKAAKRHGLRGKMEGNTLKDYNQGLWGPAEGPTNNSNGFNALPGGFNVSKTNSVKKGKSTVFWTSTEYSFKSAYYRKIVSSKGGIHRYYIDKDKGYAVRCVKD